MAMLTKGKYRITYTYSNVCLDYSCNFKIHKRSTHNIKAIMLQLKLAKYLITIGIGRKDDYY